MNIKSLMMPVVAVLALSACGSTPDRSEEEMRKAAETNTALGRQYMERGQDEIALEKLKRAVAFDKTYAPAHSMLAILYETIGDLELAEKEYEAAVRYAPRDGDVNNNYGAFLCGIGKREKAEPFFVTAVGDPFYDTPEIALSNAGTCALARGDLDKAESFLRQSLEYDDTLGSSLLALAEVSYRQESYLRARAFLQRFEAAAEETEESLVLGYRIETELGDERSADRYRQALLEQYPDRIRAEGTAGRDKE